MNSSSSSIVRKILLLFLVIAGLYFGKAFFIPVAIAAILAALFRPLCEWLEKHKFPRLLAPLICLLVIILFAACIFTLLGWQIRELAQDEEAIRQRMLLLFDQVQEYIYNMVGISKEEQLRMLSEQQVSLSVTFSSLTISLYTIFTGTLLAMVYLCLFLYYRSHLSKFIIMLAPPIQEEETQQIIRQAGAVAQQYLTGLAKMIVCLWILYGIGFSLIGVKSALFFAMLCGLLEIIPFIGNITGTTLTVLVSAAQGANTSTLISIVMVYGGIQFIQGWILESIIVGPQVRINPLFTILALVLGELLWGIPGIMLAIPGLAILKIICDHVDALKPYGFLFGEVEARDKRNSFSSRIKRWWFAKKS